MMTVRIRTGVYRKELQPMDTLTRIRAFIDVVEAEGFSAAARKVGRSKALLSKYVRELEDDLGALLLNRTTRQFSLTEAGHTYYRTASDILKEIDNLADLVREGATDLKGRIRVSAPRTFADAAIGRSLIDLPPPIRTYRSKSFPTIASSILSRRAMMWPSASPSLRIRDLSPASSPHFH
jgi:DNA-binding transcriptional LysR family regulator